VSSRWRTHRPGADPLDGITLLSDLVKLTMCKYATNQPHRLVIFTVMSNSPFPNAYYPRWVTVARRRSSTHIRMSVMGPMPFS
jgi:hypothetical protein